MNNIEPFQPDELFRIGDQLFRSDKSQTTDAYRKIPSAGADECQCITCRNFAAQRASAFPTSFLALLDTLGIDSTKEGEVYGCYPMPSGLRQYGGWFFFCGQLVEAGQEEVTQDEVSYHVRGPGDMPRPSEVFEPHPLALEFTIKIPWVLAGEDPDELYGPIKGNKT